MAKQYLLNGDSKWMGVSGNALFALTNKIGSGKRILINEVAIQNNNFLGRSFAGDSYAPSVTRIKILRVPTANTFDGEVVSLVKMDSNQANFPNTVTVTKNGPFTPSYTQTHPNTGNYTDSTVAVGDTSFTPDVAPSPAWVVNEHLEFLRYFIVPTGGNAGTYRIISNTATAITLDRGLPSAGATSGYIATESSVIHSGFVKLSATSASTPPFINMGSANGIEMPFGGIYTEGYQLEQQAITVRAGESLIVSGINYHETYPCFVEGTIVVQGTPNITFSFSFYNYNKDTFSSLLSIRNQTGSGQIIRLTSLAITEAGTTDTPYFQLVPISGIDPLAFTDNDKKISVVALDSNDGTLSSSIAEIFSNVPVYPFGVPFSYISDASAGSPKGFNYLNTKDFIGPVYMTFFPESVAAKDYTGSFGGTHSGNLGSHMNEDYAAIKGILNPITLREGEGIAIVSGAETATGTTSVGISGWASFNFTMLITVDNATTPSLNLTGLVSGTEVRIMIADTQTEIAGAENITSGTFSWFYDQDLYTSVDIHVHHLNYQFIRLAAVSLGTNDVNIPIQQQLDRNYLNP